MAVSKKLRFEVFKRDGFSCRYCGNVPPDITLELDHIIPISSGGKDERVNLLTSCFDCNRGKGKIKITSAVARPDLKKLTTELKEQMAELKDYYATQKKIHDEHEQALLEVVSYWHKHASSYISLKQTESLRSFLEDFSPQQLIKAIHIAISRVRGYSHRFRYMCGILHNWRKEKNGMA